MPNKNSIESEIDILVNSVCSHAIPRPEAVSSILDILQREVKKGRVEELKRNAYYSQPRKTDPLKLCGIDMTAKQVLDRLEELENDS